MRAIGGIEALALTLSNEILRRELVCLPCAMGVGGRKPAILLANTDSIKVLGVDEIPLCLDCFTREVSYGNIHSSRPYSPGPFVEMATALKEAIEKGKSDD